MRATPLPAFKQARRDSNPQPPVLETGALPVELRTSDIHRSILRPSYSGQGRNRTTDTTIFSRVLYQLSYLARYLPAAWPEKKPPGLFGDGRLGEGCALRALLEAPLDGQPSRARPRIRHRPSSGLLGIGPEHHQLPNPRT